MPVCEMVSTMAKSVAALPRSHAALYFVPADLLNQPLLILLIVELLGDGRKIESETVDDEEADFWEHICVNREGGDVEKFRLTGVVVITGEAVDTGAISDQVDIYFPDSLVEFEVECESLPTNSGMAELWD